LIDSINPELFLSGTTRKISIEQSGAFAWKKAFDLESNPER
jgi:hypothetical protein